jgi:hypothetical protein
MMTASRSRHGDRLRKLLVAAHLLTHLGEGIEVAPAILVASRAVPVEIVTADQASRARPSAGDDALVEQPQ